MRMEESRTYCLKDYKNIHCWTSIGVFTSPNGIIRQVFKCSQCNKIITEKLEEITLVYQRPKQFQDKQQPKDI